jgi:DNA-binding NtrC family response regulator
MAPAGRLVHRRADFVPLGLAASKPGCDGRAQTANAVLVFLASADLTTQELSSQFTELSGDPPADELHRAIRQFRRAQAAAYRIESLLGTSDAMRKVRNQVVAAVASNVHILVTGPPGSGRAHVARAIHYQGGGETAPKLVACDCRALNNEPPQLALDALRTSVGSPRQRPTLLLENLECLATPYQEQLLSILRQSAVPFRVIATLCSMHAPRAAADIFRAQSTGTSHDEASDGTPTRHIGCPVPATLNAALLNALSTIAIHIPPLVERLEDLPILAQYFLESCNRGSDKQIGSIRAEALDFLALHRWPRELDELREVISAAHRACTSHEITAGDLPRVIHYAAQAAAQMPRRPEPIVLDELLASIEKELVVRALAQVDGNKSAAAALLGMTRPRLYRRMVQLGLVNEPTAQQQPGPEFIEQDPSDQPS